MATSATLMMIGRLVFGAFFLIAALRNFLNLGERLAGATTNYGKLLPPQFVIIGFAMQLVGGISLLFDLWTVWGALLLILFLIVATALYHNPLMFRGKERDPHLYLMLVNITLAAGLLMIVGAAI